MSDLSHPSLPAAVALHREGKLDEAAKLYLAISAERPRDFDATHLLGVIAMQQGRYEAAQKLITAALHLDPQSISAMGNLGTSYMRDGQLQGALQWFSLAAEAAPTSLEALINLGSVLHNMARYLDAVPVLRRAYALDSTSNQVGNILGVSLLKTGDIAGACEVLEATTRSNPDSPEGWGNMSAAYNAAGRHADAGACAAMAVSLKPQSSAALGALGAAQVEQGRLSEAIESYRQGIEAAPPSAEMLFSYGYALLAAGLNDEAIGQLRRALLLEERNLPARWACAIANLKPIYLSESDFAASRDAFGKAIDDVQTWYRKTHEVREPYNAIGASQPFYIAYHPHNNRALLSRYGDICAEWISTLGVEATTYLSTESKVQVGIAAAHIHEHSVWNAITKGWVNHLDRSLIDIHFFQLIPTSDQETDHARGIAKSFTDKPASVKEWAETIKATRLDVLIYPEIGMDPLTVRLASLRLAPVQAASWGHPETSGLPALDLYISGDAIEPATAEANYREKLVRLPNFGVYVEPLEPPSADPRLSSLNLPANEPLLLCPGAPFKYTPANDAVWVKIAQRLERRFWKRSSGGRLVFFRSRSETMDKMLENRLRAAFMQAGVDFDSRVCFAPILDRPRFFGLMRRSALMLDTIDFSGFNTAIQGIEADLPVLAYEGEFMRGRLASAILRRLELPELVATSREEYIEKAIDLAGDAPKRKKLRAQIADRRDILFRDLAPIRALEQELLKTARSIRDLPQPPS